MNNMFKEMDKKFRLHPNSTSKFLSSEKCSPIEGKRNRVLYFVNYLQLSPLDLIYIPESGKDQSGCICKADKDQNQSESAGNCECSGEIQSCSGALCICCLKKTCSETREIK